MVSISSFHSGLPKACLGPIGIGNRMGGLHRRKNSKIGKLLKILRIDHLSVFDAETVVWLLFKNLLVNGKHQRICGIPDAVGIHLITIADTKLRKVLHACDIGEQ